MSSGWLTRCGVVRYDIFKFEILVDSGKAREGGADCRPASVRYPLWEAALGVGFCAFGDAAWTA